MNMRRIAVIGGGWAGCAAAVELAGTGHAVTLYEAARTLGGRARRVEIGDRRLDNGQHILLGAYSETLRLMRAVGIDPEKALLRLPLQMRYPPGSGGMDFVTPRLPAPLHVVLGLIRAKGLNRDDKMALARFASSARWMDWRLYNDCSVTELLDRFDQTDRLIQLMWRPLCIAALNTPPERASAQVFLHVLRDSLGARRASSDMLIPRVDLTALFPQRAAEYVRRQGGVLREGCAVKAIVPVAGRWHLSATGGGSEAASDMYDAVIVATPSHQAALLISDFVDVSTLKALTHEPITTCYLQYPPSCVLPTPFYALLDHPESGEWGQFVFDRGWLDSSQRGMLAVVVSASTEAIAIGREALADAIAAQLARVLGQALARPLWTKVITEKRATFSCIPALQRVPNRIDVPGLALAGDYTDSDYPSTIEAAARSGILAAQCVSQQS